MLILIDSNYYPGKILFAQQAHQILVNHFLFNRLLNYCFMRVSSKISHGVEENLEDEIWYPGATILCLRPTQWPFFWGHKIFGEHGQEEKSRYQEGEQEV